ncbi:MAG: ATP-binding protein [Candidatus Limiplasma sp.]|nr:ATP-binding protein [Candidatus Limiplasma sp.]
MMRDLSMHVLDIAQNSIQAEAGEVVISLDIDEKRQLTLRIRDDGRGMEPEFLARVTDPFTTTRTTRKVGLGIPMLKQSAELCGGTFAIHSQPGRGTDLTATFDLTHIDCLPMGEMCDTLLTLILLNPQAPEFLFEASAPGRTATFDTRQVRQAVGGLPLNEPELAAWIKEAIEEEFKPILEVPS